MIDHVSNAAGDMAALIRAHDWADTALGPMDAWPQSLKTAVGMVLALDQPALISWGPTLVMLHNDAYLRLFGPDRKKPLTGRTVAEAWPEAWDIVRGDFEQVMLGGATVRGEDRLIPVERHGRMEDVHWTYTYSAIPDADAPHGVGGVLTLVSETAAAVGSLRDADDRQLFLATLSDALRPLADPAAIRTEACRLLGERLGADWVLCSQIDEAKDVVDLDHGYAPDGEAPVEGEQPLSAFAWALPMYRAGVTIIDRNVQASSQLPPAERGAMAAIGVASLISVPLRKIEPLVGALTVAQARPRNWTAAEVGFVEQTAERVWGAIERARTEGALAISEERYRTLFDSIDEGFYLARALFDDEGRCTDIIYDDENPAAVRMIGRSAKGRRLSELGDYEDHWRETFGGVARTGQPRRLEHYAAPNDVWFDFFVFKPPSAGPDEFAVVFRDVTERRRAEQALRASDERRALMLGLSDALRPLTDAGEIIGAALEALGRHLGAGQVIYAEADRSGDYVTIDREWNDGSIPSNAGRHRLDDFGAAFIADLKRGDSTIIDDVAGDPRTSSPATLATFARASVGSLLNVPLLRNGRMVAVLGVHSAAPRAWRADDVSITEEAAERIWAAVERARAEAALRASEERLSSALEIDTVGVIFWGPDLTLTQVNRAFLAITGFTHDEAIGMTWQELTPPEFHAVSERAVAQIEATGRAEPYEKQYLRKDGSRFWGLFAPRRLADGEAVEFVLDISDQHRNEAALRESEARFRSFAETSTDTLWIADAETGRLEYLSPAYETMWGEPRAAVMADVDHWASRLHPDDRPRSGGGMKRLLSGERHTEEYRIVRPDGTIRYIHDTGFPILENDRVRRVAGVAQDLTERRLAEQALVESERRARTLMEGVPQLVWRAVGQGDWTWASLQWVAFTGQPEHESHGLGWLVPLHPDDRPAAIAAWSRAEETGGFDIEVRIRRSDGAYLWFSTRATPVRDDTGAIVEWLGTSTDIDALRQAQGQQSVLVAELQHRTRNLMGVVRATASRTLESSASLADFENRFETRIDALARVQGLLSRLDEHDRVGFDELLRSELDAMGARAGAVTLDGPEGVKLRSGGVQTLAMAIHELATNAQKYGALCQPGAHLSIRWRYVLQGEGGTPWLHVEWTETGVTMPEENAAPARSGQGRDLIEHALPYQLKAKTTFVLGPDGVRCTLSLPVSATNEEDLTPA
jgi:PAS domain S-box-containing protein